MAKRPEIKIDPMDEFFGIPTSMEGSAMVKIKDIYPFKDHPFKVLDDEKMDELVESIKASTAISHEMDGEYILPFPKKSREAFEAEMFLDKLTEYAAYFKIDKSNHICHINKTELLRQGYDVAMY